MRWLALYARSRQVPATLIALVAAAEVIWFASYQSWELMPASLAITAAVALASTGLGGQDADLDRTAAIRWPLRRFGHLVLIGLVAAGVVLAVQQAGQTLIDTGPILRNTAGTLGLAAIATTAIGARFGWTLPLAWLAVMPLVPWRMDRTSQVLTWMLRPAGTTPATVTAVVLCAIGVLLYTAAGARRA